MRSPTIPRNAEIIKTFADYRKLVNAFFSRAFNLLVVVGKPGLSKSQEFQLRLRKGESYRVKGHATPYHAYKELWRHKDQLIVIDDGELLWKEKDGRILLRSLTEAETYKEVFWASANKDLQKQGIPTSFRTRSKVAVICNKFVFGHADEYEAIMDRAQMVYFVPTPLEVHGNTAGWYWDQEIYDYIGSRLSVITNLTARTYIKAWEQKWAGMDWRRLIDEVYCYDFAVALVQELEASDNPKPQRIESFKDQTGMSQATYYNYVKMLADQDQLRREPVPSLPVMGKCPDHATEGDDAVVAAIPLEIGKTTELQSPRQDRQETGISDNGDGTAESPGGQSPLAIGVAEDMGHATAATRLERVRRRIVDVTEIMITLSPSIRSACSGDLGDIVAKVLDAAERILWMLELDPPEIPDITAPASDLDTDTIQQRLDHIASLLKSIVAELDALKLTDEDRHQLHAEAQKMLNAAAALGESLGIPHSLLD